MASAEPHYTTQGRLDTFEAEHRLPKRRASSTKKKGPATVSWPHTNPLPHDLARAGFFYKPKADTPDNCECYLCHVKLDGWEDGDDPIEEHLKHSPDCGWAISASLQRKFVDGEAVDADPLSERFMLARQHTFGENWPYETKKGWKPKVAKMVAAGWTYDPSPEFDDGVTCMYCNLSLDGWEPKDDPFAEHLKRRADCPFFSLIDEWAAARQQATKGQKGKVRAARASKGPRLSTQSTLSVASEAPSQLSLGDLMAPAEDEDSVLTSASNATSTSTTGKGGKKSAAKVTKKGGRTKKAASVMDEPVMEVDPPTQFEASIIVEAPAKPTRKASGKRKAPVVDELSSVDMDHPTEFDFPEPPKRQTRRKVSKQEPPSQIEDVLNASQIKRPTRGKAAKKTPQIRMSEDESQLQSELQAAVDASMLSSQQLGRSTRGTKRTSDGATKIMDSSVMMHNHEPAAFQSQAAKPKRGRKPKAPSSQTETQSEPQARSSDFSEVPQRVSFAPKVLPKSRKTKKATKAPAPELELEPEVYKELEVQAERPQEDDAQMQAALDELEAENENDVDFDFATSIANPSNPYALMTGTPDRGPSEAASDPPSPTPARVRGPPVSMQSVPAPPMSPVKRATPQQHKSTTPKSSPGNSSDAENKPPSSRPASVRPPLSVQRIPLAPAAPNPNLQLSPSKRMIGGGLKSTLSWSATDLEDVFLNSPVKRNLGLAPSAEQENALAMQNTNVDTLTGAALKDVVARVKAALKPEQKQMTVEQWVRWNAQVGEQRLRTECESLVMLFEKEGGRALRSLEGIECLP